MRQRRANRGAATVVVVGVEPAGMGLIRECLGTEAVLPTHATAYEDAAAVVRKNRPTVVVMGFDGNFDVAVRLGPTLAQEVPGLHMVAISQRTDPERIRAAMRAGYREYVVLPEDGDLLRKSVHESTFADDSEAISGQVTAFVGSKGGCGVTLLACNIAAELAPLSRVLLVDLDFSMGDAAAFFDLQPKSSILDVLRSLDRLDERMLAGNVTIHASKVHLLPQPTELQDEVVRGEDVMAVLTAASEAYQHVIVDCGGRIDEATLLATSAADRVFLVTTPNVVDVKNAWRRLQLLDRLGVDRGAIRLVVNKWGKRNELTQSDIEQNLGMVVSAFVRADNEVCSRAVNLGRLLHEVDKRSPTAIDIGVAVDLVSGDAPRAGVPGATRRPLWGLFGG